MSWRQKERVASFQTNTSSAHDYFDPRQRPIEIFVFIDPLCPESWSLEPYLKKLTVEYGRFFTIQPIVTGCLKKLNKPCMQKPHELKAIWDRTTKKTGMCCDGDLWIENPISTPGLASLAVKAAELQGKRAGRTFLRRIQEALFLKKKDVTLNTILKNCAEKANLDVDEFLQDLYSVSAKKALQCDHKLIQEMEIDSIPTIAFLNQYVESDGIKISGLQTYEIYVQMLKDMLQDNPKPDEKPSLEQLLALYHVIGTTEVAIVYDWTYEKAERELKKLLLKRKVRRINVKYGAFWEYKQK